MDLTTPCLITAISICVLPMASLSGHEDVCLLNTDDGDLVIKHRQDGTPELNRTPCELNHEYIGPFTVEVVPKAIHNINPLFPDVRPGGSWSPPDCRPRQKVAIVVPYRNRPEHLKVFLLNIHRFLRQQKLDYTIFLAEQSSDGKHFNRGAMRNVGFLEALKLKKFDCIVFHDVDKLPEDMRNIYNCDPFKPRLFIGQSRYTNKRHYRVPPYDNFFGGVVGMTSCHFRSVNGYSNLFWGWGSEDDDLYNRLIYHGYEIEKTPIDIGKYAELWHPYEHVNKGRHELVKEGKLLYQTEGLLNINYTVLLISKEPLYTNITVLLNLEDTYPES